MFSKQHALFVACLPYTFILKMEVLHLQTSISPHGITSLGLENVWRHKAREVTRGWRKLYNVEFCNFYCYSLCLIRMIISVIKRWTLHMLHKRHLRNSHKILVRKYEDRNLLGDLGIDHRLIIMWILQM